MDTNIITADSRIYNIIKKHPQLMEVLIQQSPKFKKLKNKIVFNTMAKAAKVKDAARIGGIEVFDLLLAINRAIGMEDEFLKSYKAEDGLESNKDVEKSWMELKDTFEVVDVRDHKDDTFTIIMEHVRKKKKGQGFCVVQSFEPVPLYRVLEKKGFEHVTWKVSEEEYRVYFYKVE